MSNSPATPSRPSFAAAARLRRAPTFAARSATSFVAARRLVRRWPQLGSTLIINREPDGGERSRRDAVRNAVPSPIAEVSILVPSKRPNMIGNIVDNVARQALVPSEVVLVFDDTTHSAEQVEGLADLLGEVSLAAVKVPPWYSLGHRLNAAIAASRTDWLARMDDDDWYGDQYLGDLVRAALVSDASMVGKATYPVVWTESGRARLRFPGSDYRFVSAVAGATMMWNRTRTNVVFPNRSIGEDGAAQRRLLRRGGTIFSADRFQFVVQRQTDATWDDHERRLETSGPEISATEAYQDFAD